VYCRVEEGATMRSAEDVNRAIDGRRARRRNV
jgi:hypothetical protein